MRTLLLTLHTLRTNFRTHFDRDDSLIRDAAALVDLERRIAQSSAAASQPRRHSPMFGSLVR